MESVLPAALKALEEYPQFILYKLIPSVKRPGKNEKIPLNYINGKKIDSDFLYNKNCWTDFATAKNSADLFGDGYGVGFIFTKNDPFFLLDIDNCLTENRTWSDTAIELLSKLNGAAVEVSSSLTGLHIIGKCKPIEHACKNSFLKLELYTDNRFVALTGINAIGSADTECSFMLNEIVNKYFLKNNKNNFTGWTEEARDGWRGSTDDTDLIMRALRSNSARAAFGQGASFRDLWEANYPVLETFYNADKSAYDFALAIHLAFWTGNNCERMLRLMKQSKLYREKWEREDYLQSTILKACARQDKYLIDKEPVKLNNNGILENKISPTLVNGATFLTVDQQLILFENCVYVRDEHRVLIPGGDLLKPDQFKTVFGGFTFQMDATNERLSRNAWEAFSESQAHRKPQVDSTCFRPDLAPAAIIKKEGRTAVNVYYPVETPRRAGDITPFLTHLEKLIADERDREILICYMAACVQHKGIKFHWAPLIQGVDGNGKSLFTKCVAFCISYRYSHFPDVTELTEKYNSWMYKKLFIGIEDAYIPDSAPNFMEKLKTWITGEQLEIRAMHSEKVMREICCNYILNSNHKDAIKKSKNDRRYAPFYTQQQREEDLKRDGLTTDYFISLWSWLEKEHGYEIVNEYLTTYPINPLFNPALKGIAPITASTHEAISCSLGAVEQEILEAIDFGLYGFKNGWISSLALEKLLEKIKATKKVPQNRRRDVLFALGYDWHPHLIDGRANVTITAEGGRPKLFIKSGHPACAITNGAEIVRTYTAAQTV